MSDIDTILDALGLARGTPERRDAEQELRAHMLARISAWRGGVDPQSDARLHERAMAAAERRAMPPVDDEWEAHLREEQQNEVSRPAVRARFREFIRPIIGTVESAFGPSTAVAFAFDPNPIGKAQIGQGAVEFFDWNGTIWAKFEAVSEPIALSFPDVEYILLKPEMEEPLQKGYFIVKQFSRELALLFIDLSKRSPARVRIKTRNHA